MLLASQLLPSTLIGSNNVQVARLVMGCHKCIRACLGMFLCISPNTAQNLHPVLESGDLEQAAD